MAVDGNQFYLQRMPDAFTHHYSHSSYKKDECYQVTSKLKGNTFDLIKRKLNLLIKSIEN